MKLPAGSAEKSKDNNNKHTHTGLLSSESIATRIGGSKKAKHIELKHLFVQQRMQGGTLENLAGIGSTLPRHLYGVGLHGHR